MSIVEAIEHGVSAKSEECVKVCSSLPSHLETHRLLTMTGPSLPSVLPPKLALQDSEVSQLRIFAGY